MANSLWFLFSLLIIDFNYHLVGSYVMLYNFCIFHQITKLLTYIIKYNINLQLLLNLTHPRSWSIVHHQIRSTASATIAVGSNCNRIVWQETVVSTTNTAGQSGFVVHKQKRWIATTENFRETETTATDLRSRGRWCDIGMGFIAIGWRRTVKSGPANGYRWRNGWRWRCVAGIVRIVFKRQRGRRTYVDDVFVDVVHILNTTNNDCRLFQWRWMSILNI